MNDGGELTEGPRLGNMLGTLEGTPLTEGGSLVVGLKDKWSEGCKEGRSEGNSEEAKGSFDGTSDFDGTSEGYVECVGAGEFVGPNDGGELIEGAKDGNMLGTLEGMPLTEGGSLIVGINDG